MRSCAGEGRTSSKFRRSYRALAVAEHAENEIRKDFTPSERVAIGLAVEAELKAFAAEVGRILEKLSENGNSDHYGNFPNGKGVLWIDELSKNAGMERRTVQNWWAAFTKSAGLSITPKQAGAEEKARFFAWLDEQKAKDEAAKASQRQKSTPLRSCYSGELP